MQTGMSDVREDKAGSNLFSASQYWRIPHSVTVINTTYQWVQITNCKTMKINQRLPSGRNLAINLSPESSWRARVTGEMVGHDATTRGFEYILRYVMLSKKNCLNFWSKTRTMRLLQSTQTSKCSATKRVTTLFKIPRRREAQKVEKRIKNGYCFLEKRL